MATSKTQAPIIPELTLPPGVTSGEASLNGAAESEAVVKGVDFPTVPTTARLEVRFSHLQSDWSEEVVLEEEGTKRISVPSDGILQVKADAQGIEDAQRIRYTVILEETY